MFITFLPQMIIPAILDERVKFFCEDGETRGLDDNEHYHVEHLTFFNEKVSKLLLLFGMDKFTFLR
jgi:hypothetical protein